MGKEVLLVANYSEIEPLGLMHLSDIVIQEGYNPRIKLVKDENFRPVLADVESNRPEYVGIQTFTGNHVGAYDFTEAASVLGAKTIIGGPHPTYFPKEAAEHADYAVVCEGWDPFRRILRGEAKKGIVSPERQEPFPPSDREAFYRDHPRHRDSPFANIITGTGCPFRCTYCYNSSDLSRMVGVLSEEQIDRMKNAFGDNTRLFVKSQRSVSDVLDEIDDIKKFSPNTKLIYVQDDVFGVNIEWLREFQNRYDKSFDLHVQQRFEYINPNKEFGRERLNLLKASGCTGLTLAIESANPIVREEVLNRRMGNDLMFNVFEYISELKLDARTQQILGLPLGATSAETPVGLDADFETLELNVALKAKTGLPTHAWSTIFVPYAGTDIADVCKAKGFSDLDMREVQPSFFARSILKSVKKWVGPDLNKDSSLWLPADEQERFRDDLSDLRSIFRTAAHIPGGDQAVRDFLAQPDRSLGKWDDIVKAHLNDRHLYGTRARWS